MFNVVDAVFLTAQLALVVLLLAGLRHDRIAAALGKRAHAHGIALAMIATGLLVNLLQLLFSPLGQSAVDRTTSFLTYAQADQDSWIPMQAAIEQVRAQPENLYGELFFDAATKFQYPPTSLVLPDLAQRATGVDWSTLWSLTNVLSWLALPLIGVMVWRIYRHALVVDGERIGSLEELIGIGLGLMVAVGFNPLTWSFLLGQVQTLLSLCLVASVLAWQTGRLRLGGVLVGLCCAIKPQWAVVVLWALLRRKHDFWLAAAVTGGAMLLTSLVLYGWWNHVQYLEVLSFLSRHGEVFYANQSMNGLMSRLLEIGDSMAFDPNSFPPYDPVVYGVTLATSLALMGGLIAVRDAPDARGASYGLVLLTLALASPIAWEHHYGFAVCCLFLAAAMIGRQGSQWWQIAAVIVSYASISQFLPEANLTRGLLFGVLQSYLYFGALLLLLLLYLINGASQRGSGALGQSGEALTSSA